MANYTQEDLIRYLYKETSVQKSEEIGQSLLTDAVLQEEFEALSKTIGDLDTVHHAPSKQSIDNIMNYAAAKRQS